MTPVVVEVTDEHGAVAAPDSLARAQTVHRQLRDRLPTDDVGRMAMVFANGGRMSVLADGETVRAVAVWRVVENTYEGHRLYVDDLVTDLDHRRRGMGRALLAHLEDQARRLGCDVLALDSGTQRIDAHRFYFREGMHIPAFCFRKVLQ